MLKWYIVLEVRAATGSRLPSMPLRKSEGLAATSDAVVRGRVVIGTFTGMVEGFSLGNQRWRNRVRILRYRNERHFL